MFLKVHEQTQKIEIILNSCFVMHEKKRLLPFENKEYHLISSVDQQTYEVKKSLTHFEKFMD